MGPQSTLGAPNPAPPSSALVSRTRAPESRGGRVAPETIDDPERIAAIAQSLAGHRATGTVRRPGAAPVTVTPLWCDERGDIVWSAEGRLPLPPFFVEMQGYNVVYHLPVTGVAPHEAGVITPAPPWIARQRPRAYRRVSAPPGYVVAFRNPATGVRVQRELRDLSFDGIGFETDRSDRLYRGMRLPRVDIYADGALVAALEAEVVALPSDDDGERCGARVSPVSDGAADRWMELLDRLLYPSTMRGGEDHEILWDLYERAGYFSLSGKSPEWFEERRQSFAAASARLAAAPELGCHAVWMNGTQADAVVSTLRMYTGTWFAAMMAKTPGRFVGGVPRRTVLRDIQLHAYESAYHDPSCRWILTYVHEEARFNQLMCRVFTERYQSTGKGLVSLAEVVEISATQAPGPLPEGLDVGPATRSETRRVLDVLAERLPAPYVEALDLVADRFDLAEISAACRRRGFVRGRRLLVARRGDTLVAAAVLDMGSAGIHLFGFFDTVRVFSLGDAHDADAACALLDQARAAYAAAGKSFFIALEDGPWSPPIPASGEGMTRLSAANLTIMAADLSQEWFEYMHEHLSPRGE